MSTMIDSTKHPIFRRINDKLIAWSKAREPMSGSPLFPTKLLVGRDDYREIVALSKAGIDNRIAKRFPWIGHSIYGMELVKVNRPRYLRAL